MKWWLVGHTCVSPGPEVDQLCDCVSAISYLITPGAATKPQLSHKKTIRLAIAPNNVNPAVDSKNKFVSKISYVYSQPTTMLTTYSIPLRNSINNMQLQHISYHIT